MADLWTLNRNLGMVYAPLNSTGVAASQIAIPSGYMTYAENVHLSQSRVMQPRNGMTTVSTSGGPTASIRYVFVDRIGGSESIWTVTGTSPLSMWRSNSSVSFSDTTADGDPVFCAYNGKVFMAYNSDQNRLHVYDTNESSPAVRRVGVIAPSAPSVANTGAGAYAATLRYYKVQMRIYRNGSTSAPISASSELSAATSFTPSGAGTAARITKPTTVDSSTHWVVYASSDGLTYYDISGPLAVATTTYDDSAAVTSYNSGTAAPEAGLFVPPPSAKFLATNGERLIMAGAWETSASSGQTTPSPRRVWFTRPLGATDAGDDESITSTELSRYWLDLDPEDGSSITGLVSTSDGALYVFTPTSVWRLVETGGTDTPFRAERVASGIGAIRQYSIVAVNDGVGSVGVYFMSYAGPYRYTPNAGLEWLGEDWVIPDSTMQVNATSWVCGYDPLAREVHFGNSGTVYAFSPEFAERSGGSMRGGWKVHLYGNYLDGIGTSTFRSYAIYNNKMLVAGTASDGGDLLGTTTNIAADFGVAFRCQIITPTLTFGGGTRQARIDEPYVWKWRTANLELDYYRNFGGPATFTTTVSDTAASEAVTSGHYEIHATKVEGLALADAYALTVRATMDTSGEVANVDAIVIPYTVQEPL